MAIDPNIAGLRSSGIQLRGLAEAQRTLYAIDRKLPKVINDELKRTGEPIAKTVRRKLANKFAGVNTKRVRPVVLLGRLVVRQTAQKKTGLRPDFGRSQMRKGFEPALEEWEPMIPTLIERALDRMVEEAP